MYISQHSKAVIVVVDDKQQLMKSLEMPKGSLPSLKAIIVWGEGFGINTSDQKLMKQSSVPVYTWREFMALGEATGYLPSSTPLPPYSSPLIFIPDPPLTLPPTIYNNSSHIN